MIGRPPGRVGRPQLKQEDLIRIQVLYRDAKWGPTQISKVTGYSIHQIKYALKKKTTTVGVRTGRPRKGESSKTAAQAAGTDSGAGSGVEAAPEAAVAVEEGGLEMQEDQSGLADQAAQPPAQQQHLVPPGPGEPDQSHQQLAEPQAVTHPEL